MRATTGINFAKKGMSYHKLAAHNERRYKNDKNKNIDPTFSDTNQSATLVDWKKIYKPRVETYVKGRNKKNRKQGNPQRCLTVDQFLNKKYQSITRCGIITVGDTNFRGIYEHYLAPFVKQDHPELKTDLDLKKFMRTYEDKKLIGYARNFNHRHKQIKIEKIVAHGDEKFIHAHAEFIALPHNTKPSKRYPNGRPSFSFSRAVKQEYNAPNNKVALRKFHHDEQPALVDWLGGTITFQGIRRNSADQRTQAEHSMAIAKKSAKAKVSKINDYYNRGYNYTKSMVSNAKKSVASIAESAARNRASKAHNISIETQKAKSQAQLTNLALDSAMSISNNATSYEESASALMPKMSVNFSQSASRSASEAIKPMKSSLESNLINHFTQRQALINKKETALKERESRDDKAETRLISWYKKLKRFKNKALTALDQCNHKIINATVPKKPREEIHQLFSATEQKIKSLPFSFNLERARRTQKKNDNIKPSSRTLKIQSSEDNQRSKVMQSIKNKKRSRSSSSIDWDNGPER